MIAIYKYTAIYPAGLGLSRFIFHKVINITIYGKFGVCKNSSLAKIDTEGKMTMDTPLDVTAAEKTEILLSAGACRHGVREEQKKYTVFLVEDSSDDRNLILQTLQRSPLVRQR